MDPVVAAFDGAGRAIATDAWQQVREAVAGLRRRVRPQRQDDGSFDDLYSRLNPRAAAARHTKISRLEKPR